jgi:hypothetical protein
MSVARVANPHTKQLRIDATVEAVRLGANTAKRLACERRIVEARAGVYLHEAYKAGALSRTVASSGLSHALVYAVRQQSLHGEDAVSV